jgi:hypothetical protein
MIRAAGRVWHERYARHDTRGLAGVLPHEATFEPARQAAGVRARGRSRQTVRYSTTK